MDELRLTALALPKLLVLALQLAPLGTWMSACRAPSEYSRVRRTPTAGFSVRDSTTAPAPSPNRMHEFRSFSFWFCSSRRCRSSSPAMWLNAAVSSPTSPGPLSESRTERSPSARRAAAVAASRTGCAVERAR